MLKKTHLKESQEQFNVWERLYFSIKSSKWEWKSLPEGYPRILDGSGAQTQSVYWFCSTAFSSQSTLEIHRSTVQTFVLACCGFFLLWWWFFVCCFCLCVWCVLFHFLSVCLFIFYFMKELTKRYQREKEEWQHLQSYCRCRCLQVMKVEDVSTFLSTYLLLKTSVFTQVSWGRRVF